jgi:hypothetical protein
VRADGCVEAVVCDSQPLDRLSRDKVLADDLGHIADGDSAVPDRFRIHDDRGSVLALIEASGLIYADRASEAGRLYGVLEGSVKLAFSVGGAGRASAAGLAEVGADEDVALEFRQSKLLADECFLSSFYLSFPPAADGVD